ncbi:hypothetical protein HYH03_005981 [Edaphochlamys debaryana]|uniref:Uncharacterized protein n=1 Tax=Edaphochlamys debaryana TaxID=47281 RepID=A0A836C1N9_9CHLO|nr:hypothetical protein HYH03_005981 [Edaphochlamys debaryana]|eukprot:KAG2496062.1 hypothetical protein HYH03_005981 [Edaphochlamys debaryana]
MVFSNAVPSRLVPDLEAWLSGGGPGVRLRLADTKSTATVHIVDQRLNVHYAIGLTFSGARAQLSKVKSSANRCHFASLVAGPGQLDARLKLIGQRGDLQDPTARSVAATVVAACNGAGGLRALASAPGRHLPPDMRLETARRKSKAAYEGEVEVPGGGSASMRLKVTVKRVEDGEGSHTEVTGTLPDLDAELAELLEAGGGDGSGGVGQRLCDAGWGARALRAVAAFVEAANAVLLGEGEA